MEDQLLRRLDDKCAPGAADWSQPGTELAESSVVHLFRPRMMAFPVWHHITSKEMLEAAQAQPDQFELWTLFKVPVDDLSRAPVKIVAAAAVALGKIERRKAIAERRVDDRHPGQSLVWAEADKAPAEQQASRAQRMDSEAPAELRPTFEAWAKSAEPRYHLGESKYRNGSTYQTERTQHAYEGFCAGYRLAAPVAATEQAKDLSASGLLKLWERANAEATSTMPAPFVFAKLLLATPAGAAPALTVRDRAALNLAATSFDEVGRTYLAGQLREVLARLSNAAPDTASALLEELASERGTAKGVLRDDLWAAPVTASDDDESIDLHSTMDALVWTKEYMRIFPQGCADQGTMLGWFANAIMVGYDHAKREAAAPETAEPVAWMCPAAVEPEFTADALMAGYWMRKGVTVTPLYATPVSIQPAATDRTQADEAQLYRDLTGDAMALGYEGIPDALEALRAATDSDAIRNAADELLTAAELMAHASHVIAGTSERNRLLAAIDGFKQVSQPAATGAQQGEPT